MSPTGAAIMGAFGAVWWIIGVATYGRATVPLSGVGLVVAATIIMTAWRRGSRSRPQSPEEARRQGRLVGIASAVEGVLIFLAVNVLVNVRRPDLIAPAGAIIVGLHFPPLARWLPARLYYATAALLTAAGVAGLGVADTRLRIVAVSVCAAAVLWLTCGAVLMAGGETG